MGDRKSVEIRHLSARNLTLGMSPKLPDTAKDRGVFAVQGPASFVGFPSFYMQPDKTPRNVETQVPALTAGTGCERSDGFESSAFSPARKGGVELTDLLWGG